MIPQKQSIDLRRLRKENKYFPQIIVWAEDERVQVFFENNHSALQMKKGNNEQH